MLLDAPSNKSSVVIFPELSAPGGTFTFSSTTVAVSMELPDFSLAQLLRQSVLFFIWGVAVAGSTHTYVCLYTLSLYFGVFECVA